MTQKWNVSGYTNPTGATVGGTRFTNLQDGLETALSCYSGTDDPSSGAPAAWGSSEVGFLWYDTTNQRYGSGDDLGGILKRWERIGASSYGFRTLNAVSWTSITPSTNALDAPSTNLTSWVDLDLTTVLSTYAIRALIQVEVKDTIGVSSGTYLGVRTNGDTTERLVRRVYPPAVDVPVQSQMWVDLDADQIMEYRVAPYSDTGNGFHLRIDVVAYQERI